MKVKYNVDIKEKVTNTRPLSEDSRMVVEFAKGDKDNMELKYATRERARMKNDSIKKYIRRHYKDVLTSRLVGNSIYVMRK